MTPETIFHGREILVCQTADRLIDAWVTGQANFGAGLRFYMRFMRKYYFLPGHGHTDGIVGIEMA